MKKPSVFVVTFLVMLLSVNAVFAERDVTGSTVIIESVFAGANPFYTPGNTYSVPFELDNVSTDGAEITSVTLDFPAGITVDAINGTSSSGGVLDLRDFDSITYPGAEYLDYGLETGDGASVTFSASGGADIRNAVNPGVDASQPGLSVTVGAGFTGPIVISWTIIGTAGSGGPNSETGVIVWGPPYGIATFTATATIAGPTGIGGAYIVNDVLTLDITTIGTATSMEVDLTAVGGTNNFAMTVDPGDPQHWTGTYTIVAGVIDNATASLLATADFGGPTDTETLILDVDNIMPIVTDWGAFSLIDLATIDDTNNIADYNNSDPDRVSYTPGTVSVGDGDTWEILASTEFTGDFSTAGLLTQDVILGTLDTIQDWDPTITVFDNAGNTVTGNASTLIEIDNVPPDTVATEFTITSSTRDPQYAGIGDVIRLTVDITGQDVASGEFNFWMLDPSATGPNDAAAEYIIAGTIVGTDIYAEYTVQAGDNEILDPPPAPGLVVDLTLVDLASNVGNFQVSGGTGNEIYVDGTAPMLGSDISAFGDLRFSPDTNLSLADYTGYTNMPDSLELTVILPDWGTIGGAETFFVRIEREDSRELVGIKEYSEALNNVFELEYNRDRAILSFFWDGEDPNNPGTLVDEGNYGFTLWSVLDGAGNEAVLGHDPENFNGGLGITVFNAEHGVVDNTPPEYIQDLTAYYTDDVTTEATTLYRYIEDTDLSNSITSGDDLLEWDETFFQFAITRDFTQNTDDRRKETATYWIKVEGPDTTRYFYGDETSFGPGATGDTGVDALVEYIDEDPVLFATDLDVNAYIGQNNDIIWSVEDTTMFAAGSYTVTTYVRDNAGNIRETGNRATIIVEDVFYQPPTLTNLEVISRHSDYVGLGSDLPDTTSTGVPIFYLDSYFALPGGQYYETSDTVVVEIELAEAAFLDSVVIELNSYGGYIPGMEPEDVVLYPSDFTGNVAHFSIPVEVYDQLNDGVMLEISDEPMAADYVVTIFDNYLTWALNPVPLSAFFILEAPEEPVWPDTSDITVTLSADRFSPGWYTNTYDAELNPARDNEQDQITVEVELNLNTVSTKDFDWFLEIDNQDPARWVQSDSALAGSDTYNLGIFNFYGLQNDPTLDPLVGSTDTDSLTLKFWCEADGYDDPGYIDPPGLSETLYTDGIWVDNSNPEILTVDGNPLMNWDGDPNYAGHLYEDELVVSSEVDTTNISFTTSEPMPDGGWQLLIVDYDGNPIDLGDGDLTTTFNVIADDFMFDPTTGTSGYTSFRFSTVVNNIPTEAQQLEAVFVVVAPNDEAGNPYHENDPHYPYDTTFPYHAGSDAYRWDSAEAFARFMILEQAPYQVDALWDHENSYGFYFQHVPTFINEAELDFEIQDQGYISESGIFHLDLVIPDEVYLPIDIRDITSIVDIDFSPLGVTAVAQEANATIEDWGLDQYMVIWDSIAFDLSETSVVDGETINIPVTFSLDFTGDDAGHAHQTTFIVPIIADFTNPMVTILDPVEMTLRDIDINEGTSYLVQVEVTDEGSGIWAGRDTLFCDDPSNVTIVRGSGYTPPAPPLLEEDFESGTMPTGWTNEGDDSWDVYEDGSGFSAPYHPDAANSGTYMAGLKHSTTGNVTTFVTPEFSLAGSPGTLTFYHYQEEWFGDQDILSVYYRESTMGPWILLETYNFDVSSWTSRNISVPASAVQIGFEGTDDYGYGIFIDDVLLEATTRETETYDWTVIVAPDADVHTVQFTAQAYDNVANMGQDIELWDVGAEPTIEYVELFNADFPLLAPIARNRMQDGHDVGIIVNLTDIERIDSIRVQLNTNFSYGSVRADYEADQWLVIENVTDLPTFEYEFEGEGEREVTPNPTLKLITLQGVNSGSTLVNGDDVFATIQTYHDYEGGEPDDDDMDMNEVSSTVGDMVIDNIEPTIENLTYVLESTLSMYPGYRTQHGGGIVTFTAEITDPDVSEIPYYPGAGVDPASINLDLTGLNGDAVNLPTDYTDGVATWTLDWPDDFSVNALDTLNTYGIDGIIDIYASDYIANENTVTEIIDTTPVVDSVKWYVNDVETNVILPDDLGLTHVDVYVTAEEFMELEYDHHLNYLWDDRVHLQYVGGAEVMPMFDSNNPVEIIPVRETSEFIFRFEPDFNYPEIPEEGYLISEFNVFAISMYNLRSDDYQNDMIVADYPREDLYGIVDERAQEVYTGVDPSGWFAPEHNIRGEMTFFTPTQLNTDIVIANFDYVGDFVDPWINPDQVITDLTETITLNQGTPHEFNITFYTQRAIWDEITTDAQSIWSLIIPAGYDHVGNIEDGYKIPIDITAYLFGYELPLPTKYIRVDMNDPAYATFDGDFYTDAELLREYTSPGDYEISGRHFDIGIATLSDFADDGFGSRDTTEIYPFNWGDSKWDMGTLTYTLEVPYENMNHDVLFDSTLVLGTMATDWTPTDMQPSIGGVDPLRIDTPVSVDGNVVITPFQMIDGVDYNYMDNYYSPTPDDSLYMVLWKIEPVGAGFTHGDSVMIQLGKVWDKVGHNNGSTPIIKLKFDAEYQDLATEDLMIYKYIDGEPENSSVAPYVQAGSRYGIKVPVEVGRSTEITGVDYKYSILEGYATNIEEADLLDSDSFWQNLSQSSEPGVWYLPQEHGDEGNYRKIGSEYGDGTQLYTKLKITYANSSVQETGWITARTENYAVVDGVDPEIIEYGIEIWSETLGYEEEGYVVPEDGNAKLKITITDNVEFYEEGAVPWVEVTGLSEFVDYQLHDGTEVYSIDPLVIPADYIMFDGTYWIAEIDSMVITGSLPEATQKEILVSVEDGVGNAYYGNPASKFVEITEDGPIVPVIKGIEVIAGDATVPYTMFDPSTDTTGDYFYISEGADAPIMINVYVRAKFKAYIEELWLNLETIGGSAHQTILPVDIVEVSDPDDNLWMGTFELDGTALARTEEVIITANTIRHPYGAHDVFTDELMATLFVDTNDIEIVDPMVSTWNVDWTINPDQTIDVVATFVDILGDYPDSLFMLPGSANTWFEVGNDGTNNFFDPDIGHLPADAVFTTTGDTVVVEWHFDENDLHEDLWTGTETEYTAINFYYRNIYGERYIWNSTPILIDNQAPVVNESSSYTYGENHQLHHTIVRNGVEQDSLAMLHLEYTDVTGVYAVYGDWDNFDGQRFMGTIMRDSETIKFPYSSDVYGVSPEISMNNNLSVDVFDNVRNVTRNNLVNTTFVFDEDYTYMANVYPNEFFINTIDGWYTKEAALQMYIYHNVMGFDLIDNDADVVVDEVEEGLIFDPLTLQINNHEFDTWYPFPHAEPFTVINDTTLISLEGDYANFSEGAYTVKITTENIYQHVLENYVDFNVDKSAPMVTGIRFGQNGTFTPSYDLNDIIISYTDWDAIRVLFDDGIILGSDRAGIPGVGVDTLSTVVLKDAEGNPIEEFNTFNWDGSWLEMGLEDTRWAHENLLPGNYELEITAVDLLGNTEVYTKSFFYNFQEADIDLHVFDYNHVELDGGDILHLADEIAYLGATVNDTFGMVTQVDFQLWFDENNNNQLDAADIMYEHISGAPDVDVPFEATWHIADLQWIFDNEGGDAGINEHMDAYNYRHDATDYPTDIRDWFIITTATSNSGQVTSDTSSVMLQDNVGPAPTLMTITNVDHIDTLGVYHLLYDNLNYNGNKSVIGAIAQYDSDLDGTVDHNWPDAWYVDFEIYNPQGDMVDALYNSYMEPASDYYYGEWNWGQYAIDNPGIYTIKTVGFDRCGNDADGLNEFQVNIYTAGNAWAELEMWNFDVPGWDLINMIPDGDEFGPNDPVENILHLRIDAVIHNIWEVQEAGFFYNVWDNSDGVPQLVSPANPLPNDELINPDFGNDASVILPQEMQFINGGDDALVRIVVPEDVYRGAGYDEHDYTYEFYIMITDFTGVPFMHEMHIDDMTEQFRVDYVAPEAYMVEVTDVLQGIQVDDITVAVPVEGNAADEWVDGYDLVGFDHEPTFKWSYDGVNWTQFTTQGIEDIDEIGNDRMYFYNNWDTYVLDQLAVYNYEGWVYVTAEVQDRRGNWADAEPTMVYVDNQAPEVPIVDVSYRATDDYDNYEPSVYQQWHELGTLVNEDSMTITCAYNSLETDEDALLRMRVHQSEILNLSEYGIPAGMSSDLEMPITLYHAYEGTLSSWHLYDHEVDADGYYYFSILLTEYDFMPGAHYFGFVASDYRGNLEGDVDRNGMISEEEFMNMWDLKVNLVSGDPVWTEIVNPHSLNIYGEWINLGAEVFDYNGMDVEEMTFQYSSTGHPDAWTDIATVMGAEMENDYFLHIFRNELPDFDALPFIPGVHVFEYDGFDEEYDSYDELAELEWNGVDAWEGNVLIPIGYNTPLIFVADLNDDGEISEDDYELDLDVDPNFYHPNNPDQPYEVITRTYETAFNTMDERLATGIYYFRAVPDGDPRGAMVTPLFIDNDAPVATIDIMSNDEEIPVYSAWLDELTLVTDIDGLLVTEHDVYDVYYQYSVQAPGTEYRQWFTFAFTEMMEGDFQMEFDPEYPGNDQIDNDGDGFVDEADEANAPCYIRSYAYDVAGNYGYSDEIEIEVDGSLANMHITDINGIVPAGSDVIVNIPEDRILTITATDITPEYLDGAVYASFGVDGVLGNNYTLIAEMVPVVDGHATAVVNLDSLEIELDEGYYLFGVSGIDRVDHVERAFFTPVILNDVIGPDAMITSVNGHGVMPGGFMFTQEAETMDVTVRVADPNDVGTVTLEYSVDGNEPWHNINTIAYDNSDSLVNFTWTLPAMEDEDWFLRALPEDHNANDEIVPVIVYVDNTAPVEPEAILSTLIDVDGITVLDIEADSVRAALTYYIDENHGMLDVANVVVNLNAMEHEVLRADYNIGDIADYMMVGTEDDVFVEDLMDPIALTDEYVLEVIITDFAGNVATYEYYTDGVLIDVTAPNFVDFQATETFVDAPWAATWDDENITFDIEYNDLYMDPVISEWMEGVGVDSVTVEFDYEQTGIETETYTYPVTNDTMMTLVWDPQITESLWEDQGVEISLTITDKMGNVNEVQATWMYYLRDLVPPMARFLYLTEDDGDLRDVVWPEGNVAVEGDMLDLHAFVPASQHNVMYVEFAYLEDGEWTVIDTIYTPNNTTANGVGYYQNLYAEAFEFVANWDISELGGTVQVRSIAYDDAGLNEENMINVTIYDVIYMPTVYVDGVDMGGDVERGETYTVVGEVEDHTYLESIDFYKKYVDDNGHTNYDWEYIGSAENMPYTTEWFIDPTYVTGLELEVIAVPTDIYGNTFTPNEFLHLGGESFVVRVMDTTAPEVVDLMATPDMTGGDAEIWLSGMANIEANINTPDFHGEGISENDLALVEFFYDDGMERERILISSIDEFSFADPIAVTLNEWDISFLANGSYNIIVKATDTAGNFDEEMITVFVDNMPPAATVTINSITEGILLRGEMVTLVASTEDMDIDNIEFMYNLEGTDDWAAIGTVTSVPYTMEWQVPYTFVNGATYNFVAVATDLVGLVDEDPMASPYVIDDNGQLAVITNIIGNAGNWDIVNGMHLHNDAEEVVTLQAIIEDGSPWAGFKYSVDGENWTLINTVLVNTQGTHNTAEVAIDLTTFEDGQMLYLGVVALEDENDGEMEVPELYAMVYVDHSVAVDVTETFPYDNFVSTCEIEEPLGYIEISEIPEDLDMNNVVFEYILTSEAPYSPHWTEIGVAEYMFNGTHRFVLEVDHEDFDSGIYDFRYLINDGSIPWNNNAEVVFATNVLVDNTDPVIEITEFNGNILAPYEVVLSETAHITATVTDEAPSSGIDFVEFWNGNILIGVDEDGAPYEIEWNTTGLDIDTYTITAIAYDVSCNTDEDEIDVQVLPFMEPYAVIVGFDFDHEVENWDKIYAITRDCQDRVTEYVRFEYLDGNDWIAFGIADAPMTQDPVNGMDIWGISFNADNMITSALRAVAVFDDQGQPDTDSSIKPELAVNYFYTPEQGGIFQVADATVNEDVKIFWEDDVHIMINEGERVPFVLAMNEVKDSGDQATATSIVIPIQSVDSPEMFEGFITGGVLEMNDTYGNELSVWSAAVDPMNNYQISLNQAVLNVHPVTETGTIGTVTSEDGMMAINVPVEGGLGHIYFETVHTDDEIPLEDNMIALTGQEAVLGEVVAGEMEATYSIYFDSMRDVDVNATVYAVFDDDCEDCDDGGDIIIPDPGEYGGEREINWIMLDAEFIMDGDQVIGVTFTDFIHTGIFTIVQLMDPGYQAEFVAMDNQYTDDQGLVWGSFAPAGYGLVGWLMDMIIPPAEDLDFYFRTYAYFNEETGEYEVDPTVEIDVYLDDIRIVDNNMAADGWVGEDLVVDPVSGMFEIELLSIHEEYFFDDEPGTIHEMTVMVYQNGFETATATQQFAIDSTPANVDNLTGGGYIRHNMTIAADFYDDETNIDINSIQMALINPEVIELEIFVPMIVDAASMDITEIENGYHVEYTLAMDDLGMIMNQGYEPWNDDVNEIWVVWSGMNNTEMYNWMDLGFNPEVYIVDVAPPQVWAISPVGDPIDNDGDGLFNEDPVNGINEDLDFVDANNNGVQDGMWVVDSIGTYWVGEQWIVDEDPFDYVPDTLLYGNDVVVAIGYEDIPGPTVVDANHVWYSGACGVDPEGVIVTLNGEVLPNEDAIITNGTWQWIPEEWLEPGHYVVLASVPDMIGNVGSVSFEFEVVGPAPVVEFIEPEFGWWIETYGDNDLAFEVHTIEGSEVAFDGVLINVYEEPGNTLIMGPTQVVPDGEGIYHVNIAGGVVAADKYAVRLQVEATNIWQVSSEANQTYLIDNDAPIAQITQPENGQHFDMNDAVTIIGTYSDVQEEPGLKKSVSNNKISMTATREESRNNGSGVDFAEVTITDPNGVPFTVTGGDNYVETIIEPENLLVGDYNVMLVVKDAVGNITVESVMFTVDAPQPTITFHPFNGGWWFSPEHNDNPFEFTVEATGDVAIAEDGVVVTFYAVPGMEVIQGPQTLAPVEAGMYEVFLGANVPNECSSVILKVEATNVYDGVNVSSQTYGVDGDAPEITFVSPANEAHFVLGTAVNVHVTFTDNVTDRSTDQHQGIQVSASRNSFGSGIISGTLKVMDPMGTYVINETVGEGVQSIEAPVTDLIVGTYTAIATVTDKAGNTSAKSIVFYVDASELGIMFHELGEGGMWYGPELNVPLSFTVAGNIANNGVEIKVYGQPTGDMIQGPQVIYPVNSETGLYEVWLAANVTGYSAITLEVKATNVSGINTVANQTYGVDQTAPEVVVESPVEAMDYQVGNPVVVRAYFDDSESGIASAVLKIDGEIMTGAEVTDNGIYYTGEFALGTHVVEIKVTDNVMNRMVITRNFTVSDASIELEITDAHVYPNPVENGNAVFVVSTTKSADVIVKIYDFAGKEVRSIRGTDRSVITWDCKTEKGTKLARGIYFAKISVNDGKSVVDEMIKIAVK